MDGNADTKINAEIILCKKWLNHKHHIYFLYLEVSVIKRRW